MTPKKEDYLKLIFEEGGYESPVGNKQIAEGLGVAAASVSEMLQKLQLDGYIEYTPYRGARLTEEGMVEGATLLRKHRLWEVFLVRHLGYPWSEVHEEAELLEHVTPPRLVGRLEQFLSCPRTCPHGGVIPDSRGHMDAVHTQPLAETRPGWSGTILRVLEEPELLEYLSQLKLDIGTSLELLEAAPYEGPYTVQVNGVPLQVSYKAACNIFVNS